MKNKMDIERLREIVGEFYIDFPKSEISVELSQLLDKYIVDLQKGEKQCTKEKKVS